MSDLNRPLSLNGCIGTLVFYTALLASCAGYTPGTKAYWDAQIDEMCQKDGGIRVYETVQLTRSEYQTLGGAYGGLPVPDIGADKREYPYYRQFSERKIREANPEV